LKALLAKGGDFEARLLAVGGKRVARGDDFDRETGRLKQGSDTLLLDEAAAKALQGRLRTAPWSVADVKEEARQSSPKPPFTTSTMQQEANNRLNLSARDAMSAAQRLFENGFITYMRTDSTALSEEGLAGAAKAVRESFGADHLHPGGPRRHDSKAAKNAQEAHEAIRPAGADFVHPDKSDLTGADLKLYRLIWQRTLASQMANERYVSTTVTLAAAETTFTATGKSVQFPGYRAVYGADEDEDRDRELPPLRKGDRPVCRDVLAEGHETKPPARFTEASLVAALDKEGIGRPSTYASILDTIQGRGYVVGKGKALVPSFTAFAVVGLLEKNFPTLVDLKFTAEMEEALDRIAAGEAKWQPFLGSFFLGPKGLRAQVAKRMESLDPADARVVDLGAGRAHKVKIGRFGPYVEVQRGDAVVTASLPEGLTPDELDDERIAQLITAKEEGPRSLGSDPETGKPVFLMDGRFGPYVQLGEAEGDAKPPRSSLPKGRRPEEATLEEALFLLSLPRTLGEHPQGGRIVAGLGRFGPYIARHKPDGAADYRNLPSFDAVKEATLDSALALLAAPKAGRGRRAGPTVLRALGNHPEDGAPVQLLEGRFGPYVKHGDTNATVPRGKDPATLTMEDAVALLAERKARGPPVKAKRRRPAAR
ncbi:MAG TPA: DNA topoisomerase, partial [Candidatus Thermoplasmatota archaeon]|nr:DNA topoisomerase [Candidatus Thermoplasmatota archaeon]